MEQFPTREEAGKTSINTQLVRIQLIISVDWEHEIELDQMASATATLPVTEVGHTAMTDTVEKD